MQHWISKNLVPACIGTALALSFLNSQGASKNGVDFSKIPPPSDKTGITYASDIRPIFEKWCFRCHGPEKSKARLRLDSLDAVLKGGEDGKVIVVGKSADSLLVHNVSYAGPRDSYMPPSKDKAPKPFLTKEQIALIRAWIDQGAK
jgi:mono/diheme cytochrome c family protein